MSFAGGIFAVFKYNDGKNQQNFNNYHKLIETLNRGSSLGDDAYLDIQLAAIFELRFYKRYKILTIQLLERQWINKDNYMDMAKSTLDYLKKGHK